MKIIKTFFLYILLAFSLWSCNNKVDINADYKDITIAYGLLDPSQTSHFVKITKAFQTDGNVYVGAKDSALSQYNYNDIDIYIDEYSSGYFVRTIPFDTVLIDNKDSGVFYSPYQVVYGSGNNVHLNQNNEYKLYIKIKSIDKEIKSNTFLIHDFSIAKPNAGQKYVGFTSPLPQTVEWRSAENGKLYQLNIRFFYTEVVGNTSSVHYVDMPLNTKKSNGTKGGEKMSDEFYGESFYQNLAAKIALPTQGMIRYSDSLHYIFSVADENFSIYMDVNKPSSSVVQERPAYTNIENGIGIFAGRYNKIRFFKGLAPQSIDTLIAGQYTYALGFKHYPFP